MENLNIFWLNEWIENDEFEKDIILSYVESLLYGRMILAICMFSNIKWNLYKHNSNHQFKYNFLGGFFLLFHYTLPDNDEFHL